MSGIKFNWQRPDDAKIELPIESLRMSVTAFIFKLLCSEVRMRQV
jgi:hypothetical protein